MSVFIIKNATWRTLGNIVAKLRIMAPDITIQETPEEQQEVREGEKSAASVSNAARLAGSHF